MVTMGFSIESDGSRRYRLSSTKEIVRRDDGYDYSIDYVRSKLGMLATVEGRIYSPVDRPDQPLKVVNSNGFMAPSRIYDGVAAEMANLGVTTAVYDTMHPLTPKDLQDPLLVPSMGGRRMLDIMQDITGEETENVAAGHSMGGLTAARLVSYDSRFGYWLGDASAGPEHERMTQVHIENAKEILTEEVPGIAKEAMKELGVKQLIKIYAVRFGLNPSQVFRQAYLLCANPDITPYLQAGHDRGVVNGVLLHEFDAFFKLSKQLDEIKSNSDLYNAVTVSKGTKHGHANTHPRENAILRLDIISQMQGIKHLGSQALASAN